MEPQACWDCRNKELGAFLHSPLMDELRALEALSDAHRQGLPASPRAAAAAFHAAAHPHFSAPGPGPQVRASQATAAPCHAAGIRRTGWGHHALHSGACCEWRRKALIEEPSLDLLSFRNLDLCGYVYVLSTACDPSRAVAHSELEMRALMKGRWRLHHSILTICMWNHGTVP